MEETQDSLKILMHDANAKIQRELWLINKL